MSAFTKIHSRKARTRLRRKRHIRKRINGTAERPRLSVFRSNSHIYAQVVDDVNNVVVVAASDLDGEVKAGITDGDKSSIAKLVGETLGRRLLAKDIRKVVFDRNGFIYHGRVKSVADGAREAGLEF